MYYCRKEMIKAERSFSFGSSLIIGNVAGRDYEGKCRLAFNSFNKYKQTIYHRVNKRKYIIKYYHLYYFSCNQSPYPNNAPGSWKPKLF